MSSGYPVCISLPHVFSDTGRFLGMSVFTRVMFVTGGGLFGGLLGFYWREKYLIKAKEEKRTRLQEQLQQLTKSRMEKEKLLHK